MDEGEAGDKGDPGEKGRTGDYGFPGKQVQTNLKIVFLDIIYKSSKELSLYHKI